MSVGNLATQGDKKNNWTWQNAVLQLLGQIATSTGAGSDYETRTTTYKATAAGPGYSIDDILVRFDIITMPTGVVTATVWFNQTTQAVIAAPAPANIVPIEGATSVNVNNGPGALAVNIQDGGNSITIDNPFIDVALSTLNREVTQLLIQALLTTIDGDTSNLDVLLSTRASEATLLTRLSKADFEARINILGQKLMAASTPVVIASDQSAIGVKGTAAVGSAPTNPPLAVSGVNITTGFKEHIPLLVVNAAQAVRTTVVGISRTPSLVLVPINTAVTNTTAGVQEVSIRVIAGANAQIGGVAVPNGTSVTYRANPGDTVGSISYQTGAGTRMLISYII